VEELSWSELLKMTHPDSGFVLTSTVTEGRSLEAAVSNPYVTPQDRERGKEIFRQRCAVCHESGAHGPALDRPGLKHGDSDLSICKTIRDGIAGTGMAAAADLSFTETWQVLGFIRSLQTKAARQTVSLVTPRPDVNVTLTELSKARGETDQWLTYSGAWDGWRYSPLDQITPENVGTLRLKWTKQFDTSDQVIQATPIVADGVLFITEPPASIIAYNVATGKAAWKYIHPLPDDLATCCGRVNRGLAILDDTLFMGTLDGFLIAVDANTGALEWSVQVADPANGFSITGAPLAVNGSIVVGVSGGEFGVRGFLVAYDPDTGEQNWKFNTIPGPGKFGHETWENDAWTTGGGPTWITGSYDPELELIYWGVANPAPVYAGDVRPGDNLFTNSVIALRAKTGELAWHFQFTPHDDHDWDSNQTPILTDATFDGESRKVILWANRNGFYYVLDRTNGEFLTARPYVEQNWADGLTPDGRPILAQGASATGRLTRPGVGGGTNWQNPAFDPKQKLIFVPATEGVSIFTKSPAEEVERGQGGIFVGSGGQWAEPPVPFVRALDSATGEKVWEYPSPSLVGGNYAGYSGLLATAGGVVFGASGGSVFALNSATGEERWRVPLGGDSRAAPITFTINREQVLVLTVGRTLFVFGL
jgi:alcohol dehydrogenase (cytochrome c)